MTEKSLYDKILYYLTVPKCVCCEEPLDINEDALCNNCKIEYENIKLSNCSVCSRVMSECLCVNDYLDKHFVHKLIKIFRYRQPEDYYEKISSNELIYNIKRVARRDLLQYITDELERVIVNSNIDYKSYLITNIPRKKSRILEYGHDHAELISRSLAKRLGIKYVKTLRSVSLLPQKKTHGAERITNARFDYIKKQPDISGKRVMLFDDIVTTGASMGNAAALVKGLGAKEIVGVCISVAYKDKFIPFAKEFTKYK